MKISGTDVKNTDFRVWCAACCIRIAPHEEQIAMHGKSYHPRCYSKHPVPGSKPLPAAGRSGRQI